MRNMKIAIIILNYNSSADCEKCIGFLKKQENQEAEIVVVDNCSEGEDKCAVEQLCQKEGCTFIANNKNLGYNAGNNVGLRYAASKGYEYAMVANPDMEFPQSDYLYKMLTIMDADRNIAVCGSDIVTPEGVHQNPMLRDGNWRNSFAWIKEIFARKQEKDKYDFIGDYSNSQYCHKVSGCCLMVRINFIKEINYFDEYPFLYCEEAILSKQVEKTKDWKIYYTADIQCIHRHIKNEKGNPIPRLKQWKRSRLYFINQYSSDNWVGKLITKLSEWTRIQLIILYFKIRQFLKKRK